MSWIGVCQTINGKLPIQVLAEYPNIRLIGLAQLLDYITGSISDWYNNQGAD